MLLAVLALWVWDWEPPSVEVHKVVLSVLLLVLNEHRLLDDPRLFASPNADHLSSTGITRPPTCLWDGCWEPDSVVAFTVTV